MKEKCLEPTDKKRPGYLVTWSCFNIQKLKH